MLWWCQDNPDSDWESFSTPLIKRFKNSYGSHIFKRLTAMKQEVQTKMESSSKRNGDFDSVLEREDKRS